MRLLKIFFVIITFPLIYSCSTSTDKNEIETTEKNVSAALAKASCGNTVFLECVAFQPGPGSIKGEIFIVNNNQKRVEVNIAKWNSDTVLETRTINSKSKESWGWAIWPQSCPSAGGLIRIKSCKTL